MLNANGESFEALKTLSYITSTVYDDGSDDPHLKCVDIALKRIEEGESSINVAEAQARSARLMEHRNREAATLFQECLKEIRLYMQKVGYYLMMSKSWDNRITPTATMKTELAPPKSKTYKEKLPSELL
jgi:hypothetical protein